ncbi:MAG TPA: hypothetical protein VKR30_00550 [Candidatus Limnocylindrales bacterium]|nr:hypothetical protein [Candidatus Limnocylindrales bacterium]
MGRAAPVAVATTPAPAAAARPALAPAARPAAAAASPSTGQVTKLAKLAAVIQVTFGSYLGLAAAVLIAASAAGAAASDSFDPAALGEVRLWAVGIGIVMAIGGRMASRGSAIGRLSGIVFGTVFGVLAGIAVVDPLPGLPASVTVPFAVVVLVLMTYVVAVDLFAWRRSG